MQKYKDGASVSGILLILFLFCKLAKVTAIATWSWWWVLAPVWLIPAVLLVVGLLLYGAAKAVESY